MFYCGSLIAALVRAKALPWYVRANCESGPLSAHIEVRFVASADVTRERGESCRTPRVQEVKETTVGLLVSSNGDVVGEEETEASSLSVLL